MTEYSTHVSNLDLRHYSASPEIRFVPRPQGRAHYFVKPVGLWVEPRGYHDSWEQFCLDNSFQLWRLRYRHRVALAPTANVIRLNTSNDMFRFTEEFGQKHAGWWGIAIPWDVVAQRWHGIVIVPYLWACRLDPRTSWYYGWDCASGCIWHQDAIASITRDETYEPQSPRDTAEAS